MPQVRASKPILKPRRLARSASSKSCAAAHSSSSGHVGSGIGADDHEWRIKFAHGVMRQMVAIDFFMRTSSSNRVYRNGFDRLPKLGTKLENDSEVGSSRICGFGTTPAPIVMTSIRLA